ncbi:hypothetical protein HMI56_006633 [Coelomomyces lativittatus]|nr:hypothetical protein HMI56_006633 [Coelomomyces lativittatus]
MEYMGSIVCVNDAACDPLMTTGMNGTCYSGNLPVFKLQKQCNVTNPTLVAQLNGEALQVTYTCDRLAQSCHFEFWISQIESFHCALHQCVYHLASNTTYCAHIQCTCLPDALLCGKNGFVDISEFLKDITGPGHVHCNEHQACAFSEPKLDELMNTLFAESSIQLQCRSGECLHVTQVPSSDLPGLMELSGWMYVGLVSALFSLLGLLGLCFFTRRSPQDMSLASSSSSLLNTDTDPLLNNHLPITLAFEHVTYHVATTSVLHQVHGYARPGQLTAIMGSSGAGKSTLLDLLAHREKSGVVREGGILSFNGRQLPSETYSRVVGYVDQEDTLMSTLTVEETILYSALLRLPSDMSYEAKVSRVKATMVELGIAHLANQRIGNSSKRGISGGEKRRVSIACEMVTSPSVLLLDEPTSGLDAFNAYKVVECLMNLARTYQRTIVLTIHQPRSNIFALFDTLILLSKGNVVYSGEAKKLADHLKRLGYPCPPGYNLADYLMDLTFKQTLPSEVSPYMSFNVQDLIAGYHASTVFKETQLTIKEALIPGPLVLPNHSQRPGFWNQFKILASRTFKHTLRHPSLLLMHYLIAIVVALLCGTMFWQLSNDIPGFQNRLGCFFFITSLFMFSCLSSIHVFAQDRILFTRERANGYYQPITFFLCKTFFDLIPLRVFPPIVLGLVMYPMVGLVNLPWVFFKFLIALILFNLTAASWVFLISLLFKDVAVANLAASLLMLFSMLFGGLLLNSDTVPFVFQWIKDFSFFNYALEALIVNELKTLTLTESKFGLQINVPAAVILSSFGFDAQAYWIDIAKLVTLGSVILTSAYLVLHFFVKEKR